MEYLYLDESGQFEGDQARPLGTFVGGFRTTSEPARVAKAVVRLLEALAKHAALGRVFQEDARPGVLHARDLYGRLSDSEQATFRGLVLDELRRLEGLRLVSTHYFADAEVAFVGASDARMAHRFLRMWQATVRHALFHQPEPGEAELMLIAAQRSVPEDAFAREDRRYLADLGAPVPMGRQQGFRVLSTEQVPRLLLDVVSRGTAAPFPRTFAGYEVGHGLEQLGAEHLAKRPFLGGLLLADLACDLIRYAASEVESELADAIRSCPALRVAYSPRWSLYERLCESAADSPLALEQLVDVVLASSTAGPCERMLQEACARLLSALLARAEAGTPLRAHVLAIARDELARKEGRFPRCERLLGEGGLRPPGEVSAASFDEWIVRTAYQNHTGGDAGTVREQVARDLERLLAHDLEAFLRRGEDLAHLAVSYQDEFDYERAAEVVTPFVERARPVYQLLAQGRPEVHWTTYGRVLGNLAQTLAYRQAEGDLELASELAREARPHMRTPLDLAQWGCHAANLASLTGDEALFRAALEVVFETHELERLLERLLETRFGPERATVELFGFTVLSRHAVTGVGPLADSLRERLSVPDTWTRLLENVRHARPAHPLELYARHLLELAPPECAALEPVALALSLQGFGGDGQGRIANTLAAGTLALYARKLLRRGDAPAARARGREALERFTASFAATPWLSPTTFCEETPGTGWFDSAVRALRERLDEASLDAFVARFRFELR